MSKIMSGSLDTFYFMHTGKSWWAVASLEKAWTNSYSDYLKCKDELKEFECVYVLVTKPIIQ